jgi:hypothetical protein
MWLALNYSELITRLLIVELTHPHLNPRFYVDVFTINILLGVDDVFIDNRMLLVTDFVDLKIKLSKSFRNTHRSMLYVHIFIWMSARIYMSIYFFLNAALAHR